MIDWARVNELREEIGAEDFIEVVDLFLEEADEVVGRFGDLRDDEVGAAMHFLKGMALNLGFSAFAQLCQRGEAGGAGSVARSDLVASYLASKQAFDAELDRKVA